MANPTVRSAAAEALDAINAVNIQELVEHNYENCRRELKIGTPAANLAWALTEEAVMPQEFAPDRRDQPLTAVLKLIDKHISPAIQHKLSYDEDDKPKVVLDQIKELSISGSPVRHEKLQQEARPLVRVSDQKILDKYINGLLRVRRKMRRCAMPKITQNDEKETFKFILLGLLNHQTYGQATENTFSGDLQSKVGDAKERLEQITQMVAQNATETRYCQPPSHNERFPDDIYKSIGKMINKKLKSYELRKS